MTDSETTPPNAAPEGDTPPTSGGAAPVTKVAALASVFTQANITTGLAVLAVLLAAAPYVVPPVQSWQTERGLLGNAEMLETAVNKLNADRRAAAEVEAQAALQANAAQLKQHPWDPVMGNPDGPIRVIAFIDYNCGVCRGIEPKIEDMLKANPDVALVIKEFPVITEHSMIAAAYALAAQEAGHYEAVHKAFMSSSLKTEAEVQAAVRKAGLDPSSLAARANSAEIRARLNETTDLGIALKLNGTPAYIVGGVVIPGADINAITTAVAAQRAGAAG